MSAPAKKRKASTGKRKSHNSRTRHSKEKHEKTRGDKEKNKKEKKHKEKAGKQKSMVSMGTCAEEVAHATSRSNAAADSDKASESTAPMESKSKEEVPQDAAGDQRVTKSSTAPAANNIGEHRSSEVVVPIEPKNFEAAAPMEQSVAKPDNSERDFTSTQRSVTPQPPLTSSEPKRKRKSGWDEMPPGMQQMPKDLLAGNPLIQSVQPLAKIQLDQASGQFSALGDDPWMGSEAGSRLRQLSSTGCHELKATVGQSSVDDNIMPDVWAKLAPEAIRKEKETLDMQYQSMCSNKLGTMD